MWTLTNAMRARIVERGPGYVKVLTYPTRLGPNGSSVVMVDDGLTPRERRRILNGMYRRDTGVRYLFERVEAES